MKKILWGLMLLLAASGAWAQGQAFLMTPAAKGYVVSYTIQDHGDFYNNLQSALKAGHAVQVTHDFRIYPDEWLASDIGHFAHQYQVVYRSDAEGYAIRSADGDVVVPSVDAVLSQVLSIDHLQLYTFVEKGAEYRLEANVKFTTDQGVVSTVLNSLWQTQSITKEAQYIAR